MSQKVLIRTPNHLGDCIMALPMINEVREAHPGSGVTLLVPDGLDELFVANPAIDDMIKIPAQYVHGLIAVMKRKMFANAQGRGVKVVGSVIKCYDFLAQIHRCGGSPVGPCS